MKSELIEEQEEENEEANDGGENPADWDSFAVENPGDIAEAGSKAVACTRTDNVDRYKVGQIMGKLFSKFFASSLRANV